LSEISLENVRKLKIEIDWKNKKINYSQLEFFETPEEKQFKKREVISEKLYDYIRNNDPCTIRLTTTKNKDVTEEQEKIFRYTGCRSKYIIFESLESLLIPKRVYRFRINKTSPFYYSLEPFTKEEYTKQKGITFEQTTKRLLLWAKMQGEKFDIPYGPEISKVRENKREKLFSFLGTKNRRKIGMAVKKLVEENILSRNRINANKPYIYILNGE